MVEAIDEWSLNCQESRIPRAAGVNVDILLAIIIIKFVINVKPFR